jgi:hypothetical protein
MNTCSDAQIIRRDTVTMHVSSLADLQDYKEQVFQEERSPANVGGAALR